MITEAVLVEGAKAVAKKVAKEAAKKVAKEAGEAIAKKAGKEIVEEGAEQAAKKVAKSRSIYTDDEKKELQRLRSKRNYYKNKMKEKSEEDKENILKIPLSFIRKSMSEQTAQDVKYTELYFEPEHSAEYYTRDFREWMQSNNDYGVLDEVLADCKIDVPEQLTDKIGEYYDKIKEVENAIQAIKGIASGRKTEAALKAIEIAGAIL